MARTSQVLRQGSNASDAVPFGHRILQRARPLSAVSTNQLFLYWAVAAFCILIGRAIHTFVIKSFLKERGVPSSIWAIHHYYDWAHYKRLCIAEGHSLTWWYVLVTLHAVLILLVIGWFYLILSR